MLDRRVEGVRGWRGAERERERGERGAQKGPGPKNQERRKRLKRHPKNNSWEGARML